MIITGIAHPPDRLREREALPSIDLVHLAREALKTYGATHLLTSLAPGWEHALAKAALELAIPFTVAIPYSGRDASWPRDARQLYLDLLARAGDVFRMSEESANTTELDGHLWRVDRADQVLALWDYEFNGDIYLTVSYALQLGTRVANLWQDWQTLYSLRKSRSTVLIQARNLGAQVFESRGSHFR